MTRRSAGEDPQAVYVWVTRIIGSTHAVAAHANRSAAKAWIKDALGDGGTWNEAGATDRYDAGTDTAIVELVPVPDAEALVVIDPPEVKG
jgi:alkylhydroperoxidase family enzyme